MKSRFNVTLLSLFLLEGVLRAASAYSADAVKTVLYSQPEDGYGPAFSVSGTCKFAQPPAYTDKVSCGSGPARMCVGTVTCDNLVVDYINNGTVFSDRTSGNTTTNDIRDMPVARDNSKAPHVLLSLGESQNMVVTCNDSKCNHADIGSDASDCISDKDFSQVSAIGKINQPSVEAIKKNMGTGVAK